MKTFPGFRLVTGAIDNTQCPHLHLIDFEQALACQVCGKPFPALDAFTRAYIECALWSSTDGSDTQLDENYSASDLAPEALAQIVEDCKDFQCAQADLLTQAYELYSHSPEWSHEEQAGHDFWLTRNHHGAGFWDRGLGDVGRKLTDAAHVYGSCDLTIGDDERIYL